MSVIYKGANTVKNEEQLVYKVKNEESQEVWQRRLQSGRNDQFRSLQTLRNQSIKAREQDTGS
jgi:hypothetical protein